MANELIAISGVLYSVYIILVATGMIRLTHRKLGGDAEELIADWMGRRTA